MAVTCPKPTCRSAAFSSNWNARRSREFAMGGLAATSSSPSTRHTPLLCGHPGCSHVRWSSPGLEQPLCQRVIIVQWPLETSHQINRCSENVPELATCLRLSILSLQSAGSPPGLATRLQRLPHARQHPRSTKPTRDCISRASNAPAAVDLHDIRSLRTITSTVPDIARE